MITGDHKDTARAIAIRLGIIAESDLNGVITGSELDELSDSELQKNIEKYSVYARVAPEHKVRIVKAWQARGKIVAMVAKFLPTFKKPFSTFYLPIWARC